MGFLDKMFGAKSNKDKQQVNNKSTKRTEENELKISKENIIYDVTLSVSNRQKALKNTDNIEILLKAFESDTDDLVISCADMRLRDILSAVEGEEHLAKIKEVSFSFKSRKDLASHAKSADLRTHLLAQIEDEQSLSEVIAQSHYIDTQALAIERISDMEMLRNLVKRYKSSKKKLYNVAKNRLNELKFRQQHIETLQSKFADLTSSSQAQTLSMTAVLQAQKQLTTLKNELSAEESNQYEQQLETLRNNALAIEVAKNSRHLLIAELATLHDALKDNVYKGSRADFNGFMNAQQQAWLAVPEWTAAEAKGLDIRFEQQLSQTNNISTQYFNEASHKNAQKSILSKCQHWLDKETFVTADMIDGQELSWHEIEPVDNAANIEFNQLISQLREKSQQKVDAQNANDEAFPKLIVDFEKALEDGEVNKAQNIHADISGRLKNGAGLSKSVYQSISEPFKQLENRLHELKGWQYFGADHVRQDLIDEMQGLIDNVELDIRYKADQVQDIQKRWKEVQGHAPQALWTQFKTIADQAWVPCAEYFKSQRGLASEQLQARLDFLAEVDVNLNAVNWSNPNWKAVSEAHRKFQQMWRDFPKLPDQEYRKAQKAHEKIAKSWENRMDEERLREQKRRENLIQLVEAQQNAEDTTVAINAVKKLQQQWSPTLGLRRRAEEQALWERFRGACDVVFDAHGKQRDAIKEQENNIVVEYQEQLNAISTLLDSQGNAEEVGTQFHRAVEKLNNFDGVSEKGAYALQKQLNVLSKRFDNYKHERVLDKRLDCLTQLNHQDMLCIQLERSMLNPERLEDVSNKWIAIEPLLSDGKIAMRKRFEGAVEKQKQGSVIGDDLKEVISDAQEICLLLEMAADLPSPDFAKATREILRLKILNASMNGDKSFDSYTTEVGLYDITVRWRVLPKGGFHEYNSGASFVDWCARFDESVKKIRADHALKSMPTPSENINQ